MGELGKQTTDVCATSVLDTVTSRDIHIYIYISTVVFNKLENQEGNYRKIYARDGNPFSRCEGIFYAILWKLYQHLFFHVTRPERKSIESDRITLNNRA